jgi:hypothetical protein
MRSSSKFEPGTAWCTESCSMAPHRTQRFPSRSLAARLSRCHAERSSSGREEPERCGRAQRAHRPREPGGRTTPQREQRRASTWPFLARGDRFELAIPQGSVTINIRKAYAQGWTNETLHGPCIGVSTAVLSGATASANESPNRTEKALQIPAPITTPVSRV